LVHSTHSSYFYSSFYPTSLDISTLSLHYALPICLFRHLRLRFRPRLTARPCRPSQAHHQRNYRTDRSPRSEFHLPSLFALLPTLSCPANIARMRSRFRRRCSLSIFRLCRPTLYTRRLQPRNPPLEASRASASDLPELRTLNIRLVERMLRLFVQHKAEHFILRAV